MIVIQPVTHYSIITIINWETYQEDSTKVRQATRHPTRHPTVTQPSQTRIKTLIPTAADGVRPLLDLYVQLFEEKVGKKPVINFGKDGKHLKGLLKVLGEEGVRDILHRFFSSSDPFITKAGYTIGVLHSVANKLIVEASKKSTADEYVGSAGRKLERVT